MSFTEEVLGTTKSSLQVCKVSGDALPLVASAVLEAWARGAPSKDLAAVDQICLRGTSAPARCTHLHAGPGAVHSCAGRCR